MNSKTKEVRDKIHNAKLFLYEHGVYYKHYKGGVYNVIDVTLDTQTGEAAYIYKRLAGPEFNPIDEDDITYCRPVAEWSDKIEGDQLRFTPVREVTRKEWIER